MVLAEAGGQVVKVEPGRSKARLERESVDESVTHFG